MSPSGDAVPRGTKAAVHGSGRGGSRGGRFDGGPDRDARGLLFMSVATSPPRPAPTSAPGGPWPAPSCPSPPDRATVSPCTATIATPWSPSAPPRTPRHPATRPPGHPAIQAPGHPATRPPSHPGTRPPGHPATRASRHPAIQAPGHPAIQAPGRPGAWVRGKHSNGPAAVALAEHAATAAISVCVRRSARHARTPRRHATTGVSVTRMSGAAAAGLVVRTRPRP